MTRDFGKSAAEQLATPAQFLKGVGPRRAELLAKLGLRAARDILFFFPRDYQDMSRLVPINQLEDDQLASVVGTIEEVDMRNTAPGRSMLGALVRQDGDYLRLVWFNQPHMRERVVRGRRVLVSGKVRRHGLRPEMTHPRIELLGDDEEPPKGRLLGVYPLTEGINQTQMRRIVASVVETFSDALDEVFPAEYLEQHDLWPIRKALPELHSPADAESLAQARRRFAYQELLVLQLALAMRRRHLTIDSRATPLPTSAKISARIRRLFPFELTPGQEKAIDEIHADMGRQWPMNRLLQGDVGSGKTVVASSAILLAVAHRHQAALMAPTEVLARQHARTIGSFLQASRVRVALLTGSVSAAQRRRLLEELAEGEIDVVIGTQAIVQTDVQFARLGLVVIDEQHKFGVRQRATLRQAGLEPHYLVMTATPIPRTVAMTLFGDLDTSVLRDGPPGRQPVHTYLGSPQQRASWWKFFRKKLREGRQGYVIAPLVDESETIDATSLEEAFETLANGELEEFRLDLIHGRMSVDEKEAAMDAFRRGRTQVLVATSVVEVGVDVPNATVMTIESGERFGLAQLHQLRGRVSRGTQPGYVCVFSESQNDEATRRMEAFTESTDGFRLAETDFRLRGPGDLFGTRQHGLPPLRVADLLRDEEWLDEARHDAQALIGDDPNLADPKFAKLRRMVLGRYGKALDLGDVG